MSNPDITAAIHSAVAVLVDDASYHGSVYDAVVKECEFATMLATMEYCKGNQSSSRAVLGISRATLRKKLIEYGILYAGRS